MTKEKILVIFSGGLDSTTLVYYLHALEHEVHTLSFDYGQKHKIELEKAALTCKKLNLSHKIVNMQFMKELLGDSSGLTSDNVPVPTIQEAIGQPQPKSYVPFRNMLMASIALSYAEAVGCTKVALGIQKVDEYSYWDTTPKFRDSLNEVCKQNRLHQIRIISPFVNMSKAEEILIAQDLKMPLEDTHTCYNGTNCGSCPTCSDRIMHFAKVGIKDPLKYQKEINWNELFTRYKMQFNYDKVIDKIEM